MCGSQKQTLSAGQLVGRHHRDLKIHRENIGLSGMRKKQHILEVTPSVGQKMLLIAISVTRFMKQK